MSKVKPQDPASIFFKEKVLIFFHENGKLISQFLLSALFIGMAAWFISHEHAELHKVKQILSDARITWIITGVILVALYIIIQGIMYQTSFRSVNTRIRLRDGVILFLKRNFISVFLPAGAVSSLAFFGREIEKKGISRTQIYFASSIYAFVGILSVVIVAIPAFILTITEHMTGTTGWLALGGVILILASILVLYNALRLKKFPYKWFSKIFPSVIFILEDIESNKINKGQFVLTVLVSVGIEFIGIAHVYVSMMALGLSPSLALSVMTYIIVVLFLIISPFLRGLGAIEVSMTVFLVSSGFSNVEAIAVTVLFRFFEFWLPFFAGIVSFMLKIERLLFRIFPAILIFALGVVNIISVVTPVMPERLRILKDYLLVDFISFSNSFVLIAGLFLLVTSAFMLKGSRSAWWFALALTIFSVVGNITKGIDYEESSLSLIVMVSLFITRKEYYVRTNPRLGTVGLRTSLLSIVVVMIYGITGFYFLDKMHFQIDFSLMQSIKYTISNFFIAGSKELIPYDSFARDFIFTIKISGFASLTFLFYTLIRPYVFRSTPTQEEYARAEEITRKFGRSALDFFKIYSDKMLYLPPGINAFLAYRVSRNYAVVLENPVSEDKGMMRQCINSFSRYCFENGLKDIYYRVPKESIGIYRDLSKKSLLLGQEGVVDLSAFSLEGGERKSIRNALNKINDQGYITRIYSPPLLDGLIQKLRTVSEEWLKNTGRSEIVFSQGMFNEQEIKGETVITVENKEEKIIAFMNLIPDYADNECTYDLLRKTADAPNGIMDYLLVQLFRHAAEKGFQYVNIGFAPLSGLAEPQNFAEKSLKFAYEKIRSFSHYKGQREYKEKFNPVWYDKYLVYSSDYDLIRVPSVLAGVIRT